MNLQEFAEKYQIKIRKDGCGDEIIPGRRVEKCEVDRPEDHQHVYEEGGRFFTYLTFPTRARWNSARRRLEAVGLTAVVDADADGIMSFNPEDELQVRPLLKIAGVRVKRQLTPEQLAKLQARFTKRDTNVSVGQS